MECCKALLGAVEKASQWFYARQLLHLQHHVRAPFFCPCCTCIPGTAFSGFFEGSIFLEQRYLGQVGHFKAWEVCANHVYALSDQ